MTSGVHQGCLKKNPFTWFDHTFPKLVQFGEKNKCVFLSYLKNRSVTNGHGAKTVPKLLKLLINVNFRKNNYYFAGNTIYGTAR